MLLIVAALDDRGARDGWRASARALGLDVLVEVHDEAELDRAVAAGADLIGVNNRNLRTLAVDVDASFRLAARMPAGAIAVAESGLKSGADLRRLQAAGYRAFLIGERFMTADDPGEALAGAAGRGGVMLIKICGLTRADDARRAVEAGATAIGMVFWPGSPRAVTLEQAEAVAGAVGAEVLTVGVFVDATREEIDHVMRRVPLGAAQLHGHESPAFVDTLPWPVIKAVPVPADGPLPDLTPWAGVRVLLDAHDPVRRGGTGRLVDWARAAALAATRPVILAGGPDGPRTSPRP